MTRLLTDPDTGRLVAYSGGSVPVLDQTLDSGSGESFSGMTSRRMAEIKANPPRPRRKTYHELVAIERGLGWETVTEASVRQDTDSFLDARAHMRQREINQIVSRRPELKSALLGRRAVSDTVTCPSCGALDDAASRFCTSCGVQLTPGQALYAGQGPGDTAQCDCGRMNPAGSAFCAACGRPIPVTPVGCRTPRDEATRGHVMEPLTVTR